METLVKKIRMLYDFCKNKEATDDCKEATDDCKENDLPKMKRQTHMYCTICYEVAESYNQQRCFICGSVSKWSIPWKNDCNKSVLSISP